MLTVAEWKSNKSSVTQPVKSISNPNLRPVSEWKKNLPQPVVPPITQTVTPVQPRINIIPGQSISQDTGTNIPATDYRARYVAPVESLPPVTRPGRVAIDTLKETLITDQKRRWDEMFTSFTDPKATKLDKATKVASVGMGVINTLFLPVTVPLSAAEQMPIIGNVAKEVNKLFGKAGEVGSNVSDVLLDKAPISSEAKETLRPVTNEIFALLGQVALGKASHSVVKGKLDILEKKAKEIIDIDISKKQTLPEVTTETPGAKKLTVNEWKEAGKPKEVIKTPEILEKEGKTISEIHTEFDLSEPGYRIMAEDGSGFTGAVRSTFPKWVPDELRSKDLFNKVKDLMGDGKSIDSITIPPERNVKQRALVNEVLKELERRGIDTSSVKNKINEQTTTTIRGGDEGIKRGEITADEVLKQFDKPTDPVTAKEIIKPQESKLIETGLQSRVFDRLKKESDVLEGDLTYDPIKLKEDSARAVDLISKDKQKAYDIAMGKELSKDITSTAVNIAMAEKALGEGNIDLYTKLIKNRSLAQTRRGQEIVSERGSLSDNSTSRYVKELIESRLNVLGKKYLSDIKDKVSNKKRAMETIDKKVVELEKKIKTKKLDVRTALDLLDKLACI